MCALLVSSVSVVHNVVRQCMSNTCLEWTLAYSQITLAYPHAANGANAASLGMVLNLGARLAAAESYFYSSEPD